MSTTTFKLITQKHMGSIRPAARRELTQIEKRQEELLLEMNQLEEQQSRIVDATLEHLKIDVDGPFRGLHLDDDGGVLALYCPCAVCQATLNNVSVVEATEVMIERGFIHQHEADHMMHKAKELDKRRGATVVH